MCVGDQLLDRVQYEPGDWVEDVVLPDLRINLSGLARGFEYLEKSEF